MTYGEATMLLRRDKGYESHQRALGKNWIGSVKSTQDYGERVYDDEEDEEIIYQKAITISKKFRLDILELAKRMVWILKMVSE